MICGIRFMLLTSIVWQHVAVTDEPSWKAMVNLCAEAVFPTLLFRCLNNETSSGCKRPFELSGGGCILIPETIRGFFLVSYWLEFPSWEEVDLNANGWTWTLIEIN